MHCKCSSPTARDAIDDPEQPPSPPFFGSGLALQGNVALAGMPGAFEERGRVAGFVRDAAGQWMRRQTVTVSDAAPGASFGEHIAIFNNRALIASRRAVYIFQLLSNKWQQTGKLSFGRSVQVRDLDWHWNTVVVGASDATGNAAYVFHMNSDGTFPAHRAARAARRRTRAIASASASLSTARPSQSLRPATTPTRAQPTFSRARDTQCVERQKLLANDGSRATISATPSISHNGILVVGAPNVDWVPGDPAEPPSERNHRARGCRVPVRSHRPHVD